MAKRMNDNWEIVFTVDLPTRMGERTCEIVIGDRHTEFEPFVAWHCFGGSDYAWGHYCQTIEEATECAITKVAQELGCDDEYAKVYWRKFAEDLRGDK